VPLYSYVDGINVPFKFAGKRLLTFPSSLNKITTKKIIVKFHIKLFSDIVKIPFKFAQACL
jgi:hypothetical protein